MAQRAIVQHVDDLTGEPIEGEVITVRLGLDDVEVELDLTEQSAAKVRDALAVWVGSARRLSTRGRVLRETAAGVDSRAVRAWASSNGITLSPRGRIPKDVIAQYRAAGH